MVQPNALPTPDRVSRPARGRPDPWPSEPRVGLRLNPVQRKTLLTVFVAICLLAATAALVWLGAHPLVRAAGASAETPLMLQVVQKPDRRVMASGNELFAVSGRIVNPTAVRQRVPDIRAELRDTAGHIVYGWTIPAPVRQLDPKASADFDSAEVNVPRGSKALNLSFAGTSGT